MRSMLTASPGYLSIDLEIWLNVANQTRKAMVAVLQFIRLYRIVGPNVKRVWEYTMKMWYTKRRREIDVCGIIFFLLVLPLFLLDNFSSVCVLVQLTKDYTKS
uniref:Uncharacterized protein n=1 Tax=Arundo donax TaxID=35708 RepID=A0A0A9DE05_ARUDO